jgi:flagellar basal-body rod protein FlgB
MMSSINFFSIASRHAEWASVRRAVVASNIANANTPGYKSRDVEDFSIEPMQPVPALATSHVSHFAQPDASPHLVSSAFDAGGQEYHSGNNVSLDRELIKAGSVGREQNLNAGLMKAFNRLIALSTRG